MSKSWVREIIDMISREATQICRLLHYYYQIELIEYTTIVARNKIDIDIQIILHTTQQLLLLFINVVF